MSTKIHAVAVERGQPHAVVLGGVPQPRYVLADKGYDTNAVVEQVEQWGAEVVIPSKKNGSRAASSTAYATGSATGWSTFLGI